MVWSQRYSQKWTHDVEIFSLSDSRCIFMSKCFFAQIASVDIICCKLRFFAIVTPSGTHDSEKSSDSQLREEVKDLMRNTMTKWVALHEKMSEIRCLLQMHNRELAAEEKAVQAACKQAATVLTIFFATKRLLFWQMAREAITGYCTCLERRCSLRSTLRSQSFAIGMATCITS